MAKTKIGGQAVMEGVMMRGATAMALAVRDESGAIRLEAKRIPKQKKINKIPFVRGVVNMVSNLVLGTKTLTRSAEVAGEDEVTTGDGKGFKIAMAISMLLGFAIAVFLFIWLPASIPEWINRIFKVSLSPVAIVAIQEAAKLIIMTLYFVSVGQNKEIKRVFMYHGAEHKTINCFEAEKELTVQNVMASSKHHDRCGTSFIVFVFLLSVIVGMIAAIIFKAVGFLAYFDKKWIRFLINLAFVPVVAAISYEVLMGLAETECKFWQPLKWLGKQMQKITTREPTEDMCEVAITSFLKVLEMDSDQTIKEQSFPAPITYAEFLEHIKGLLKEYDMDVLNAEWAAEGLLNLKDGVDKSKLKISFCWLAKARKRLKEASEGKPLQYAIGTAPFFEYFYYVDKKTLIPRQETELLCEKVIKANPKKVLDLCCGSGCIGLTVSKKATAKVLLADVSKDALKVAKANAKKVNAKRVRFVRSDMFKKVKGKFDAIVCNPPYIPTAVIDTLDDGVKNYEPRAALDGGKDGLDFYRILAKEAAARLTDGGVLYMEIGFDEGKTVPALFSEQYDVKVFKDYSDHDRMVIAVKKGKN